MHICMFMFFGTGCRMFAMESPYWTGVASSSGGFF